MSLLSDTAALVRAMLEEQLAKAEAIGDPRLIRGIHDLLEAHNRQTAVYLAVEAAVDQMVVKKVEP